MISRNPSCHILRLIVLCSVLGTTYQSESNRKLYIVYMGEKQHDDPNLVTAIHHDTLSSILGSKKAALEAIVYSYKHGFSGFAAMLTESEKTKLADLDEVMHVTLSRKCQAHTTRSWDFLQLDIEHENELLQQSNWGDDSIVGIIDTGIIPEAECFNDKGYSPIPPRWKGKCVPGQNFNNIINCNRKLIGARWYAGGVEKCHIEEDYLSARGVNHHGTHTSSTAAGSFVLNASVHGLAVGQARGGAPRARIAMYKVLWGHGGHGNDAAVLAAVDDAIHDGVDVLSLSLGPGTSFEGDASFATLHAVINGISVVYSAGNTGSKPQSVANLAPWAITVAATNIDRSFPTYITLGNNQTLVGQGMYIGLEKDSMFEDIVFQDRCDELNETVHEKVVLCQSGSKPPKSQFLYAAMDVIKFGGKGLIFAQYTTNYLEETEDVCKNIECKRQIPLVHVDIEIGTMISIYIRNAKNPVAKITPTTTVIGSTVYSPKVAMFSSRGPNVLIPSILKPDIAAPGVSILASLGKSYGFKSGTSMAAPHITGIVALLKSLHPDWSPAEIKSAIVTTASVTDRYGMPIKAEGIPRKLADPFDFGGGQVDPNRAADPGLVYNIDPEDYKEIFHCTYGTDTICSKTQKYGYNLNLPSITIPNLKKASPVTVSRILKNVGRGTDVNGVYKVSFQTPPGIKMVVKPEVLEFDANNVVQKFEVVLSCDIEVQGDYSFGSITWSDTKHFVRIPVSVRPVLQDLYADVA